MYIYIYICTADVCAIGPSGLLQKRWRPKQMLTEACRGNAAGLAQVNPHHFFDEDA